MTQIIKLNVGGVLYMTSESTLSKYRDSMLGALVEQEREQNLIKEGKELFIDRNGPIFKYVLEYLRNADKVVLPEDNSALRELLVEADFYNLGDLAALISEKLKGDEKPKWKVGDIITEYDISIWTNELDKFYKYGRRFGDVFGTIMEINAAHVVVKFTGLFLPARDFVNMGGELSANFVFERRFLKEKPLPSN